MVAPKPDITTPLGQLALLSLVIGHPNLPLQQLNRLLQCRMSWRKDRGLPPTYKRALLTLSSYLPVDEQPAKPAPKTLKVEVDEIDPGAHTVPVLKEKKKNA